jgi:Zn-dependent protease
VAFILFQSRDLEHYQTPVWYVIEYLTLFGIVLLHEFGHALACRQVGGTANRIMLWPLGGVAAGPLVNVVLLPATIGMFVFAAMSGWEQTAPDLYTYVRYVAIINAMLLIFNMLPIYPLDGGQILQSLLWFVIGQAKSLLVVSVIGMVAVAGLIALALWAGNWWLGIIAGFIALRCWAGFNQARAMARALERPPEPPNPYVDGRM